MRQCLGGDSALPYPKGTGKTPKEILPIQVFLSTANHTDNVLHLGRSLASSVDGERIPRSSDTSCVAKPFKEKIHPSGGFVCIGFDKAEFTDTRRGPNPKFCYISLDGAPSHSV